MAAKKTTTKKKTVRSSRSRARSPAEQHKVAASKSRKTLVAKLKKDLQATKKALKSATKAANAELKLAKAAAKAEISVLRDQLAVAMKREEALRKLSQEKAKQMWKAGEQWEKKQLAKLKQSLSKSSRSSS
jgi:hypothetical protein